MFLSWNNGSVGLYGDTLTGIPKIPLNLRYEISGFRQRVILMNYDYNNRGSREGKEEREREREREKRKRFV